MFSPESLPDLLKRFLIRYKNVAYGSIGYGEQCSAVRWFDVQLPAGKQEALYRMYFFTEYSTGKEAINTTGMGSPSNEQTINPEFPTSRIFGVWGYKDLEVTAKVVDVQPKTVTVSAKHGKSVSVSLKALNFILQSYKVTASKGDAAFLQVSSQVQDIGSGMKSMPTSIQVPVTATCPPSTSPDVI